MQVVRTAVRTASRGLALLVAVAPLAGCGTQSSLSSQSRESASVTRSAGASAQAASPAQLTATSLAVPSGNLGGTITSGMRVKLPRGWRAEVWARLPDARFEAWTPQGSLLVSEPDDGRVMELTPRHDRERPPAQRVLVSGLDEPQGLAFADLHGHEALFVAEADEIERYAWLDGRIGASKVVVPNLPDTAPGGFDNHTLKNIVVANGRIYFNIGSASNASPPTESDPPRAAVVSYTVNGTGLRVIATGVRNGEGLAFAPDGTLWAAVNERDQISYPFHRSYGGFVDAYGQVIQAYVNDHPPDELARMTPGRNLGWPDCDPDPDAPAGKGFRYANLPFTDDQQTNPGGAALDCSKLEPLNRGLPAHSAPLGFHFLAGSRLPSRWSQGAILAVHGSWDRDPPQPPGVLWLPWKRATRALGAPITIVSGFQDASGNRWGRPVDAVPGPDGALYVSDDTAAAIYRIVP
jgi:glucose/arabinose dehydrogenase